METYASCSWVDLGARAGPGTHIEASSGLEGVAEDRGESYWQTAPSVFKSRVQVSQGCDKKK